LVGLGGRYLELLTSLERYRDNQRMYFQRLSLGHRAREKLESAILIRYWIESWCIILSSALVGMISHVVNRFPNTPMSDMCKASG